MPNASGRILLRTDPDTHAELLKASQVREVSLNDLCQERLAVPSSLEGEAGRPLRELVRTAQRILAQELLGVVLYGSRARGEAHQDSDWDILLVAAGSVALTRRLYQRWDEAAASSLASYEVHIAHLPPETKIATGFWSEIALDGIVLYEKEFALSRHLGRVRREIAAGLIQRKIMHGQAYWVHREVA